MRNKYFFCILNKINAKQNIKDPRKIKHSFFLRCFLLESTKGRFLNIMARTLLFNKVRNPGKGI